MGCRSLVQAVVPRPDVAPLLDEHTIALAGDADAPEAEVLALMRELEGAMALPFVILASPDGAYLGGSSGAVDPAALVAMVEAARG